MTEEIPEGSKRLESLVLLIRHATTELPDIEMYDRWGHGSDPVMNRKMQQAGTIREARANATAQLTELVRRYRSEQPGALAYWANAHVQLLQHFLQNVTDATARFVAQKETAAWQALLAGTKDIVEENTLYARPDAGMHARLFGKMETPPLYREI